MKTDIHPKYNSKAKVKCSCGAEFEVGSTKDEIKVEICSNCHPLYTGNKKLVDTAGRVDRFRAKMEKFETLKKQAEERASKAQSKKPEKVEAEKSESTENVEEQSTDERSAQ